MKGVAGGTTQVAESPMESYLYTGSTSDPTQQAGARARPRAQVEGPTAGPAKTGATFPTDAKARKELPVFTGFLQYFPDAVLAAAAVSFVGNKQHNPGKPLRWDRTKSSDEADTAVRHMMDEQVFDTDGVRHKAKAMWRIAALLQKEMEMDGLGPTQPVTVR